MTKRQVTTRIGSVKNVVIKNAKLKREMKQDQRGGRKKKDE